VSEDENLGVELLSYYLKKHGHEVDLVFNPKQFDKAYTRNKKLAQYFDWKKINLQQLKAQKPDLVGFSCVTATYPWAVEFAKMIKKELNVPIIFGGVHPTLKPKIVMDNPEIDMVCIGEGEDALLELCDSFEQTGKFRTDIRNIWSRDGNKIIKNEIRNLVENIDQFEMDRKMFFDKLPSNYRTSAYFVMSRGCPFNCTYCGNEQKRKIYQGKGKYVRQKSVDQAIKELIDLKNLGTKHVLFVDDVLTMNREWFKEFIVKFKNQIGLPFTCFIHPKMFDDEEAKLLKENGCKLIWYGIQSGSEKVRREILARYESDAEIEKAAEICHQNGLKFMIDHIFDIPFDIEPIESARLYNKIRPQMINCYNLLYFPSAKIIEHALRAGNLQDQDVYKINRAKSITYQTGALSEKSAESRDFYREYALLLTVIPLLSKRTVDKILISERRIRFFGKLPLILIPMVKVILNFRVGHGFIPMAVLNTEIFWLREFFKVKFKKK